MLYQQQFNETGVAFHIDMQTLIILLLETAWCPGVGVVRSYTSHS
jgi:hypothetical protein